MRVTVLDKSFEEDFFNVSFSIRKFETINLSLDSRLLYFFIVALTFVGLRIAPQVVDFFNESFGPIFAVGEIGKLCCWALLLLISPSST